MTTPIKELLERVKSATGPDRTLDLDIIDALHPRAGLRSDCSGFVTSSIDAALALVEKVLPVPASWVPTSSPSSGWKVMLYRGMTPSNDPHASWDCMIRPHAGKEVWHDAPTAPLAILTALLSALLAVSELAIPTQGGGDA